MLDWSSWSPEVVVGVTLGSLLLLIIVVVAAMCIQAGLFHTIHIKTMQPEFGELVVMYKSGRGAYSESGAMFTEAHTLLPKYNCIGVYYDDPEKKSSENLRYIVGLVVAEGGAAPNTEDMALLETSGYQRAVFPAVKHAVVTDFPYKSTLSCIFAVFRVYPALREYVERRELCAHPILELYDNTQQRILFVGPLEQQDSFYVPDVLEENGASSPGEEDDESDSGEEGEAPAAAAGGEDTEDEEELEEEHEERAASQQDTNTWEKSASLIAEGSAEESDSNTASSFEEIDPSETEAFTAHHQQADLPADTAATDAAVAPAAAAAVPPTPTPPAPATPTPVVLEATPVVQEATPAPPAVVEPAAPAAACAAPEDTTASPQQQTE